jgi:hypothetical protein
VLDKREKCYIVKEPEEKLHEVLAGNIAEGKLWAFSKIEPDAQLSYKIFIEDRQQQVQILTTGKGNEAEYRQRLEDVAAERLTPHGNQWRKVEPVIIEK